MHLHVSEAAERRFVPSPKDLEMLGLVVNLIQKAAGHIAVARRRLGVHKRLRPESFTNSELSALIACEEFLWGVSKNFSRLKPELSPQPDVPHVTD